MHKVIHILIHICGRWAHLALALLYPVIGHSVTASAQEHASGPSLGTGVDIHPIGGMAVFVSDSLSPATVLLAATHMEGDSTIKGRVHHLEEVVVTATRQPVSLLRSPSTISLVRRSQLEVMPGHTVGSAITGVPGLYLREYGGRGGIQSVSIRGTYSEHTLVLVDGIRYNSFQNSQSDFGLLSSAMVEHIEVVKGGHSSTHGADAIGGVINIVTSLPADTFQAHVNTSVGSAGFTAFEAGGSGGIGSFGWRGTVRRERGSGQYTFRFDDGRTVQILKRLGADFDLLFAGAGVMYIPGPSFKIQGRMDFSEADRGSPGAVTSAGHSGVARLDDRMLRAQWHATWNASREVVISLSSMYMDTRQTYSDPQFVIQHQSLWSEHRNRTWSVRPELGYAYSSGGSATAGLEVSRSSIASTDVAFTYRWQRSAYMGASHKFVTGTHFFQEVILYPSVRYDQFSSLAGDVSPKIGLNIGLMESPVIRLRSSYGKSFRVPTFNELYWKAGGNPLLRSERSYSADAGLVATMPFVGELILDAGVFSITTRDRIIWSPGAGGIWSPRNIASVDSRGIEVDLGWTGLKGFLQVNGNATWTDVVKRSEDYPGDPALNKRIPYIPHQIVSVSAVLTFSPVTAFLRHSWVSHRYTTEVNDRFLPSYTVTDATLRVAIPWALFKTEAKLEVTNIFNSSYTIIPLYPLPMREYKLTLGVEL